MRGSSSATDLPRATQMTAHRVCTLEELPAGTAREVAVNGRILAFFNRDGNIFCLDGICPHSGGPLAKGKFEGCLVTCPWHFWQFNVKTGMHSMTENIRQQTYEVEVRKGVIHVLIEDGSSDDE